MSLILFEDEHLLVVNKPAGWNTHAPGPFAGEGIYDWLKHREPRWSKLAIIHRLDKETSGALVFGKTTEANRSLTEQFTARGVRKKYLFLTDREVKQKKSTVTSTIIRAGEKYVGRSLHAGGDRAETRFIRLSAGEGCTLVEAEPITGRTHQIRVHAAEQGMPILGDTLYGGTMAERVFLHAAELSLEHPVTRELMKLDAPCDWKEIAASGRDPDPSQSGKQPGTRSWIDPQLTNAFRLIHGAGDGWPGLFVDKLGDYLLAQSEPVLDDPHGPMLNQLAGTHAVRGVYYKVLNSSVRQIKIADASPRLIFGQAAPERFTIRENGLEFGLSFNEGYSVGLFLDQRDNRRRFLVNHVAADFGPWGAGLRSGGSELEHSATAPGPRPAPQPEVLNTFAYTCGFSVAAARCGARVTSLDLSKKYLEWGRRNFELNGLDPAQHDFIYGDAFDWMRRLAKKGRLFDCVILDPPTFSQSKESGAWRAEKDYGKLVSAALPLLKSNGVLFASTNAAKLEPEGFLSGIVDAIAKARRKNVQQHYVPQPPDFPISREEPAYLKTVWLRVA